MNMCICVGATTEAGNETKGCMFCSFSMFHEALNDIL